MKLYDSRDDFNFPIVNVPFICSSIPAAPAYVVYDSQLIRYSRACVLFKDFFDRGLLLSRKLLNRGFLLKKLKSSLRKFYGHHRDLSDHYGISVSQMTTDIFSLVVNTSRSFPHLWLIIGFEIRLTRRVSLVEQELLTHIGAPEFNSGVRVTRSLVLYVCFVDRCSSFCTFSFGHCVVCSSMYGFLLPIWYLQILLIAVTMGLNISHCGIQFMCRNIPAESEELTIC